MQKSKIIRSASANAEHDDCLEESLNDVLPVSKDQIIFSASTINHCRSLRKRLETLTSFTLTISHCHGLREGLEMQPVFTISTLFVSGFNISDVTPFSIEPSETGYVLWCGYCQYSNMENLTPATCSLCKYIWKVILFMILIRKRVLKPDIWSKIPDQSKDIEDMMWIIWDKEAHCRQKASGIGTYLLFLSGKEARYMHLFISCSVTIKLLNQHRFWIQS